MIKIILSITLGGIIFATVHYGVPTYHDWRESVKQAEKDAKSCASYKPIYINKRLYCQCSDTESQVPGKCSEKYK